METKLHTSKEVTLYQETVAIPETVKVTQTEDSLVFQGPFGQTQFNLSKIYQIHKELIEISIQNINANKNQILILSTSKASMYLYSKLCTNKIIGVSRGFLVYIKIVGIGYRVSFIDERKDTLLFKVGYSHDISYRIPSGIRVFVQNPGSLCLFGIDKNQLTQVAASIRHLRKPGAYKHKGIQLSTEKLQFKSGKKK